MDQSSTCLDPEVLAAFIDRRLPADERRAVEEHLVACPDCYEVFAETVRFLEEEDGGDRVRRGPWTRRAVLRVALPIAASVVVALGLWAVLRPGGIVGARPPGPSTAVARLDERVLPSERIGDLVQDHGWQVTRGGGEAAGPDGFDPKMFSLAHHEVFQAGVILTDLELAFRRTELPPEVTNGLARRLCRAMHDEGVVHPMCKELSERIARRLRAGDSPAEVRKVAEANLETLERALAAIDEVPFRLGAWAEAGRLAAQGESVEPLQGGAIRAGAQWLEGLAPGTLPSNLAEAAKRAAALTGHQVRPGDLEEARETFRILVKDGGYRWPETRPAAVEEPPDGHALSVPREPAPSTDQG